jgi:hypothetical protein
MLAGLVGKSDFWLPPRGVPDADNVDHLLLFFHLVHKSIWAEDHLSDREIFLLGNHATGVGMLRCGIEAGDDLPSQ